ncbi:MAG: hypothetical protein K8U03_27010 [Planctomycetia bacterium]|nr:hypothetical protein [Planctomycetia bacterium]
MGSSVLLLVVAVISVASAADRQWTDASGSFSVKAELVEVKDGNVHLKKTDGEVIVVAVNKLSAADRNYLSSRPAGKPVANKPADSKSTDTKPSDAPPTDTSDEDKSGLMKLADSSGDGKISRAEWTKLAQGFRDYDIDKDNALDEKELEATAAAAQLLSIADVDSDKKITRAEWAQLSQGFARLDKNRDASIDAPELRGAADSSLARASGTATLPGNKAKVEAGPTVWRGMIEGRSQIELVVNGNEIVGREIGGGGQGRGLGTGTFTMTGDGKMGNMDAVYSDGPQRGELCLGIYQMEGDTLRWCVSNRPGQRPSDFTGGRGNWPMVLTRVTTPE